MGTNQNRSFDGRYRDKPIKIGFTCSPSKNNGFETEFLDFTTEKYR